MHYFGAEGETRTLTILLSIDFESTASTSSATPALEQVEGIVANSPSLSKLFILKVE